MVLTRIPFKKQKQTLARKKNRTLFRKQTSTLFRKQSWTLFWKEKDRPYFGCRKGCYLARKKNIVFDTL